MAQDGSRRLNWAGLPPIATVARLLCRELTLQNEYLRLENRILKSKVKGRLRFTDDERRSLVAAALAMGRKLMRRVVGIVKPVRSTPTALSTMSTGRIRESPTACRKASA